jgi:acetolactate synthase-1/2/3 large subunit
LNDSENSFHDGFIQPYIFSQTLARICNEYDTIIPCSSGGANTVMMQSFLNKTGQRFFNNKALASMGYGLAGAIGAALADKNRKTVLVEGDGGFAQNLQELATVSVQKLNLKMFILANNGYASIRMTQKNYFDGAYLGCDVESGLGFPDWPLLATAFGIKSQTLGEGFDEDARFLESWNSNDPYLYVVPIHPEQTYYPKITSQVTASGSMESAPLHKMSPPLTNVVINELGLDF